MTSRCGPRALAGVKLGGMLGMLGPEGTSLALRYLL